MAAQAEEEEVTALAAAAEVAAEEAASLQPPEATDLTVAQAELAAAAAAGEETVAQAEVLEPMVLQAPAEPHTAEVLAAAVAILGLEVQNIMAAMAVKSYSSGPLHGGRAVSRRYRLTLESNSINDK